MRIAYFSEIFFAVNREIYSFEGKNYLKSFTLQSVNALSTPSITEIHALTYDEICIGSEAYRP